MILRNGAAIELHYTAQNSAVTPLQCIEQRFEELAMNDASHERRRFQRIHFDALSQIRQGTHNWNAQLQDISLKGLLVTRPADWNGDPSQPFSLSIQLNDQTTLHLEASLIRDAEQYLGFACQQIDLESISHLRRLVELNLGDISLLERELATLMEDA